MYLVFSPLPAYYYFLIMWPLPVIIFSWYLSALYTERKKYFLAILGVYLVLQILSLSVFSQSIYEPTLAYNNLQNIFKKIKASSQGNDYTIINREIDINQFHYYLILNGLKSINRPSRKGYVLFELVNCANTENKNLKEQTFYFKNLCLKMGEKDK